MQTSLRILIPALIALLFGQCAIAQLWDEDFKPLIRPDDIPRILEELSLNDDEETVLRAFYDDFQTSFSESAKRLNERIWMIHQHRQEARKANPDQPMPDLGLVEAQDGWLRTRRALERRFEEDVVAILPHDQLDQWKEITRRIRRERGLERLKTIRRTRHTTDLIDVFDDLQIERTDVLRVVLENYANELDGAIREFEFNHREHFRRYTDLRHGAGADDEDRQKEIREAYEAWVRYPDAITDLNVASVARIADAIASQDDASAFRTEVMHREYAAVFVPSPVERVLEALHDFDGLTNEERLAIEQIADSYQGAQAARRETIVNALRQWESPAEVARRSRQYEEIRKNGGDPYDVERANPALPLWEADNRAVYQTYQSIRSIFSDERFRDLPIYVQILLGW